MEEYDVISIPISDGTERDFAIMDTFEAGENKYVAVSLVENDTIEDGVYLYRYTDAEDGDMIVESIEDATEYEAVKQAYEALE